MECRGNLKNFLKKIRGYLEDWKNPLGHILLGAAIILVSAVLPLPWWARLIVLAAIVAFNISENDFLLQFFTKKKQPNVENEGINDK